MRQSKENREAEEHQIDMFADFNGLPEGADRTEFYQHEGYWQNRMVLGDSLQVMASLSEREGLQGKVQCIYIDPPYGIRFNSNFQWSTTSRDVRDGNRQHITREPEQVKAFRDTWRDGIHSYLTYLRDRLTVARDLLAESGSIFVQIGDENVHRVRALMDEVFGEENFVSLISIQTTTGFQAQYLGNMSDFVLWYAKNKEVGKSRNPFYRKEFNIGEGNARWLMFEDFSYRGVTAAEKRQSTVPTGANPYKPDNIISQGRAKDRQPFVFRGKSYDPWDKNSHWKANYPAGMERLARAGRIHEAENSIQYVRYHTDFDAAVHGNIWTDTGTGNFTDNKTYVVQTNSKVIERCILMTTDPGDLVLDPTCGSGTTSYVAEQWGRRWITIDTSRVALALARARIMGARYPYYILADSRDGQIKEAELSRRAPSEKPTYGNVRQGFVYERVPHITLRDIANSAGVDVIWETAQEELEHLREELNRAVGTAWEEWEIPWEADESWSDEEQDLQRRWWERRIARQKKIDDSIAAKADYEYLYDKPYEDRSKVRVAGPFTVESISPHRVLGVDENGDVIDGIAEPRNGYNTGYDFGQVVLENLKRSGVQQAHREDRIAFTSLTPWPGRFVCGDGRYVEGGIGEEDDAPPGPERRAAIFIGPEFVQLHGVAPRPSGGGAGGRRRWVRRVGRLRLQLRRPHDGVRELGAGAGAEGPHERRPAHGRGAEEHGQREPVRHLWGAGHRCAGRRGRAGPGAGERRGRVPPQHRRGAQRRARGHRLLVHRHGLQPGELLRPPRLLPGRRRSLQVAEDHATGRNRRGRLGYPAQRHVAPVPTAGVGADCGEGY